MEGTLILASYKFNFIRVKDKLVQHPSNNKPIAVTLVCQKIFPCHTVYFYWESLKKNDADENPRNKIDREGKTGFM